LGTTRGCYIIFNIDEIWEFIQIIIQKKRDALGGVIAILIGLFGDLPAIFESFLILIVIFLISWHISRSNDNTKNI
jgi:hypothetical protein